MEVWKDIPGYKGLYQVSDLGRVKSLSRIVPRRDWRTGKVVRHPYKGKIKAQRCTHYYLQVNLSREGNFDTYNVHQLVALVFLGGRPKNLFTDHIDKDKYNNKASNLRYVTISENNWNGSNWDGKRRNYVGNVWN